MKVFLKQLNDACHLKVMNEDGAEMHTDGSPEAGGENLGFRPMQLILAGLGSCSGIDIITILDKQKQVIENIEVVVSGERKKNKIPSLFSGVHIHYKLAGKLNDRKGKRAVDLSMQTYCSVAKILEKTARITYSYEIEKSNHEKKQSF